MLRDVERINKFAVDRDKHLTEWERDFLKSVGKYCNSHNRAPTHSQASVLERIYEKYSDKAMSVEVDWQESWTEEKSETIYRVAKYYEKNPPYYERIVSEVLRDPSSARLSKKQWNTFCENKYAKKILAEYDSDPKFSKGSCVRIRATNRLDLVNSDIIRYTTRAYSDKLAFVLVVDSLPITRASKGSRVYQVLLAGDHNPIHAHESDLKLARGVKR